MFGSGVVSRPCHTASYLPAAPGCFREAPMSPKIPLWSTTLDTTATHMAPRCSSASMGATYKQ